MPLNRVSFELRRGQIMAIVGANGSGKSTPDETAVRAPPTDQGDDRVGRRRPGHVRPGARTGRDRAGVPGLQPVHADPQAGHRARRSGPRSTTRSTSCHVASLVGLDDLIADHPRGLDTRLGKPFTDGIDISGGQWQRLAIARGFFRDAPVVILDEPSASLDPQAESDLFDLLHSLFADRIVIFVSHRFATVRAQGRPAATRDGSRRAGWSAPRADPATTLARWPSVRRSRRDRRSGRGDRATSASGPDAVVPHLEDLVATLAVDERSARHASTSGTSPAIAGGHTTPCLRRCSAAIGPTTSSSSTSSTRCQSPRPRWPMISSCHDDSRPPGRRSDG